jgi:hypothetical protein
MKIAQHSLTLWCPQARPVITSVGLVAWIGLVGCGDAGGASASDSASASASSGSTTAGSESEGRTTSESGTVSDSATAATTGGSISDSNDVTSAPTTSDSATATGTTGLTEAESVSGSDSTVGTSTEPGTGTGVGTSTGTGADTEGVNYCGDAPPPGYGGPAEECLVEPEVGTFKPVVEWTKSSWVIAPTARQIVMTPVVGPLTDDDKDGAFGSAGDIPAIVVVTFTGAQTAGPGVLRAISGDGETELFDNADEALWGGSGAAIGDLDGDGEPEIVALAVGGVVKAFTRTGALKWKSAAYPAEFAASLPQYSSPAIADMDGDGKAEVIAGRLILNSDGTLRGKGAGGFGGAGISSASFAADVDGDGVQEVVVGNALYRPNGTAIWSNGQPDGFPAVADFDGDGKAEIVVTSNGSLRLQGGDGAVIWSVAIPGGKGGPPTVADFDGDNKPEIGVAGNSRYLVFDGDGSILWDRVVKDSSSGITGSSVYDFEGDGIADVVYADEIDLYVFSGVDGAIKLKFSEHSSGTAIEYPIVADVDNDGEVEIVVVHNTVNGQGPNVGMTVLGDQDKSWRPGRRIWNQHGYSITNVNDDGTIPAMPAANWLKHNNFRSGDLSAPDGLSAADLALEVPELCERECDGDTAQIWFHLGNTGGVDQLAGADVEVHGTKGGVESLITVVPVAGPIGAGDFLAALAVVVDVAGLEQLRLVAVSKETECGVDAANEVVLVPPFCTP